MHKRNLQQTKIMKNCTKFSIWPNSPNSWLHFAKDVQYLNRSRMFHFNQLNRSEVERFEAPLNKNIVEVCLDDRSVNPTGDPTWTPVHCVMPARYCEFAERIRNLTVYDDDVWVVTFPKAGTTWTQEMVWLITNGLDYETATKVNVTERSPFLELFAAINDIELPDTISLVEQMPRPRHIKSHLPLALLPKQLWTVKPKIVYTARNPKDVTTSYMHHYRHLHGFQGSQQDYLDGILADKLIWCPQVKHATEFWRLLENHDDHVLFLHFEDMKRNLAEVIRKVCDFFGRSLSDVEIQQLEQHLSFDTMKDNKSVNYEHLVSNLAKAMGREQTDFKFMRKGQIGSYKNELPQEYINKLDRLMINELRGTNFKYRE